MADSLLVSGSAIAYRLYDIGYAVHLDEAAALLKPTASARPLPARGEAQALQIQNPPLLVPLGEETLDVHGIHCPTALSARLYDFGVCALQLRVEAPPSITWDSYTKFGTTLDSLIDLSPLFRRHLDELLARLAPVIERPAVQPVTEDYVVFRIQSLRDETGQPVATATLTDDHLVPLLLGEQRRLSEAARRELLPHRFSYYGDDLTILTWDNALVVEPVLQDRDVEYVLEFANAQLLELRVYDALLDAELPAMYGRIQAARARRALLSQRLRPVMADLQTRLADVTEIVERVENSLKVTDDVYLARIYASALELFRGQAWRRGIERKLAIIRDTYSMLNAESEAARGEALEIIIIVLILAELLLAIVRWA